MEAAFFDLDRTVIARSSALAFGRPLRRAGLLGRGLLLRIAVGQLLFVLTGASEQKMARARQRFLAATRGWPQDEVRRVVQETVDAVLTPLVYLEAITLIEQHRVAGRLVVLVSAAPAEVVEALAPRLHADEVIASRAEVREGHYTGGVEFFAAGPAKAEAVRDLAESRGLDLAASYAYSDSASDLPLLRVVGNPVAVNPDRALRQVATREGWPIRTFARQVSLGRQVVSAPLRHPVASAATAATAAGLVGAWVVMRRVLRPRLRSALARRRR